MQPERIRVPSSFAIHFALMPARYSPAPWWVFSASRFQFPNDSAPAALAESPCARWRHSLKMAGPRGRGKARSSDKQEGIRQRRDERFTASRDLRQIFVNPVPPDFAKGGIRRRKPREWRVRSARTQGKADIGHGTAGPAPDRRSSVVVHDPLGQPPQGRGAGRHRWRIAQPERGLRAIPVERRGTCRLAAVDRSRGHPRPSRHKNAGISRSDQGLIDQCRASPTRTALTGRRGQTGPSRAAQFLRPLLR